MRRHRKYSLMAAAGAVAAMLMSMLPASPAKLKGYKCGAAPVPTSAAAVFHFLQVTVNGSQVTVAPTNANGQQFDVVTYNF